MLAAAALVLGVGVSVGSGQASAEGAPVGPSGAASAAVPDGGADLSGVVITGEQLTAPKGIEAPQQAYIGAGFATLVDQLGRSWVENAIVYKVRLVNSPGVEGLRPTAQTVINELNRVGAGSFTLMAGTVADGNAPTGEIYIRVDTSGNCGDAVPWPTWAGCAGPTSGAVRADGSIKALAGKVRIADFWLSKSESDRTHVLAHEMGHALGLAHFNDLYNGQSQVMGGGTGGWIGYRAGDVNGLRYLFNNNPYVAQMSPQMRAEYDRLGGVQSVGLPTAVQNCTLKPEGCSMPLTSGAMYWSSTNGAKFVGGAIGDLYRSMGAQSSGLGYPKDSVTACASTGCLQTFDKGYIFWSASRGAVATTVPMSAQMTAEWLAVGGPVAIGMPLSVQNCSLTPEGCVQKFEQANIYWSPKYGSKTVGGIILEKYKSLGEQASSLGYPTNSVTACAASGCTQTFERGSIFWSAATGAVVR